VKYIVYQIINTANGKIYVGVHKTKNPDIDDGYMGSSVYLDNAIKKYGKDKFTKSTLYVFSSKNDAYQKEAELVNEDFVAREDTYNLKPGGYGNSHYGRMVVKLGVGIHALTFEERSKIQKERIAKTDPDRIKEIASMGGKIGGAKNRDLGLGFCGASSEKQREYAKIGIEAARKKQVGFFSSETQSLLGKKGGVKNKGFRWYNDGVRDYKYNSELSESENMFINGYRKIYDCGNLVFSTVIGG